MKMRKKKWRAPRGKRKNHMFITQKNEKVKLKIKNVMNIYKSEYNTDLTTRIV